MLHRQGFSLIFLLSAFFLCSGLLWAGGAKEAPGEDVNGLKNWDHTLDITKTKPGKYNIVVEGKDRAGNIGIAGPYNVYVDPESDIPVSSINNPALNQRVSGNLNILGTAVDDDGVERVEISLDGGTPIKAQGTEYWSYYLPVADIPDGKHTLAVIAYDINGVPSKPFQVLFNLDKFKPDNEITSHKDGVIVGGNLQFKGTAKDANEIARIEVSEDNGAHFAEAPVQMKDNGLTGEFSWNLDTRKYPDGPKVIWMRSTDKMGSVNASAFLVFIDNTPPQVEIIYPGDKEAVHGNYKVIGFVKDTIGIQKVEYEYDGKVYPIERIPGNPFFSLSLTVKDPKASQVPLAIRAQDTAGNLQELKKNILCDIRPDYPVVTLSQPRAKNQYTGQVPVRAFLKDDDKVAAFWYQLDQAKPVRLESAESLDMVLSGLTTGNHELVYWAEDTFGLQGLPLKIQFGFLAPSPVIALSTVLVGKDQIPFSGGITLKRNEKPRLAGSIWSGNGIKDATLTLGDRKPLDLRLQKGSSGQEFTFDQELGQDIPWGVLDFTIRTKDSGGLEASYSSFVRIQNDSRILAQPELIIADPGYAEGQVNLLSTRSVEGYFVGAELKGVRFEPALPFMGITVSGQELTLTPLTSGSAEAVLVATDSKGHDFRGPKVRYVSDTGPVVIELSGPDEFSLLSGIPKLTIKAKDDLGLASVHWRLGTIEGDFSARELKSEEASPLIAPEIWTSTGDGLLVLEVTARDVAGKESSLRRVFEKDSTPPAVTFNLLSDPVFGASYPLQVQFPGEIPSGSRWRIDNGAWQDSGSLRSFVVEIARDQIGSAKKLEVEARDTAGNVTLQSCDISSLTLSDTPVFSPTGPDGKPVNITKASVKVIDYGAALKGSETLVVEIDNAQAFQAIQGKMDGKPVDFTWVPGNSYGLLRLDSRALNRTETNVDLSLTVNERQKLDTSFKVKLDKTWEKPLLFVLGPKDATPLADGVIYGLCKDDSASLSLKLQMDGGSASEVNLSGSLFRMDLNQLKPGKHKARFTLSDGNTATAASQEISLDLSGPAPVIQNRETLDEKNQVSGTFKAGTIVRQGAKNRLRVTFQADNGLKEAYWVLDGGEKRKVDARFDKGQGSLEIVFPDDLAYGRHDLVLLLKDGAGLEAGIKSFYHFLAAEYNGEIRDQADTLYINDSRLVDDKLSLKPDESFPVLLVGRPIAKAWLEPGLAVLEASWDGQRAFIKAKASADPSRQVLVIQDADGETYKTRAFEIRTDFKAPEPESLSPADAAWVGNKFDLSLGIHDDHSLVTVEYLVRSAQAEDMNGDYVPMTKTSDGKVWNASIDASAIPDGEVLVFLRAKDASGNEFTKTLSLSKDTVAPVFSQVLPLENDSLNGVITVAGLLSDENRVASVEWSPDGKDFTSLPVENYFDFRLDVQKYPKSDWVVKVKDAKGNETDSTPKLTIDTEKDLPVAEFQTPPALEVQRKNFQISGMVFDDDGVGAVYYRIDYKKKPKVQATPVPTPSPTPTPVPSPSPSPTPAKGKQTVVAPKKGAPTPVPTVSPSPEPPSPSPSPSPVPLADGDVPGQGFVVDDPESFTRLDITNSFSIPVDISATGDNEHTIEMYAVDINGVIGHLAKKTFRISTAEPLNQVNEPDPARTLRELVKFSGKASDNNSIKSVELSFDNGNSWHLSEGTEDWNYLFDTRTLKDGTYNVIIRTMDKYETPGMYATLINIDNTPPVLSLDEPVDGSSFKGNMLLSGRADDTIGLKSMNLVIVPADSPAGSKTASLSKDLPVQTVILNNLDVSSLSPGWYTLRIEARDRADNLSWISRDIQIAEEKAAARIEVYYPRRGEEARPHFQLAGRVIAENQPDELEVVLDDKVLTTVKVNSDGYFHLPLGSDEVNAGNHVIQVRTPQAATVAITGEKTGFSWTGEGPWITLDSFAYGDFVSQRPYLKGSAGFVLKPVEEGQPGFEEFKKKKDMGFGTLEISFDNGRTFKTLAPQDKWQTRLETQNYPNGPLYAMVRYTSPDQETAVYHTMLMVDEKAPELKMLFPGEEGRFNGTIPVAGIANDNYELDSIKIRLREGDKASYEVPAFIQGMYLDAHMLGATTWEAGLGLTFFDDNVKLQVLVGQAPAGTRFDGYVGGVKLIANVAKLPFSYLFGPDLDFFSMSLGVGADFSYFTMSGEELNFDNTGVILGAAVIQWEFAKFYIKEWSFMRTYSFYAEGQLWFISSDVNPVIEFKPTFGMRIGLF